MKTLILNDFNTIKLSEVDSNEHFIAFKTTIGTYGYLTTSSDFVISASALKGPTWNFFHIPDKITVKNYIRQRIEDGKFEFYIFDDRKEFFTFLAEHSETYP